MRRYYVLFFGLGCGVLILTLINTYGIINTCIMFLLAIGAAFGFGLIVKSFGGI